MGYPAASPVSATHIRQHHDPTPSNVRGFVQRGWPDESPVTSDMQYYYCWRYDLSIKDGCLLSGSRVVVLPKLRSRVVDEIH